jgi:quercetin dioxygenase-like cupin family protein
MVVVDSLDEIAAEADPHAVLHEDGPRTVVLSLDADESIPAHEHPGKTVLFQVRFGRVTLTVGEETNQLEPGDIARFSGDEAVSPHAETDAEALVTLVDH